MYKVVAFRCCADAYPGGVGLVDLIQHDHRGAAVVKHQPPEVRGRAGQRVGGHYEGSGSVETVHQRSIDVVVALALCGHQKGQGPVRWENVHAAVLLPVSW